MIARLRFRLFSRIARDCHVIYNRVIKSASTCRTWSHVPVVPFLPMPFREISLGIPVARGSREFPASRHSRVHCGRTIRLLLPQLFHLLGNVVSRWTTNRVTVTNDASPARNRANRDNGCVQRCPRGFQGDAAKSRDSHATFRDDSGHGIYDNGTRQWPLETRRNVTRRVKMKRRCRSKAALSQQA